MKQIKSVNIIAGGGGSPEPHQYLALNDRTTKNVNQSSLRATNGSVAIQSTNVTTSSGLPRVLRTLAMTNNKRALARIKALFTYCPIALLPSRAAFTMAEILLSLTIIGVVAAITLPSLTGNINERTWNTQRKALYARFSQAIALMPALNGYGTLTETESGSVTADTAAETFVTDGLAKVLKINNICDNDHLADCGIPTQITTMNGSTIKPFPATFSALNGSFVSASWTDGYGGARSYSQLNTKTAAFETQNGESVAVYYNPNCSTNDISSSDYFYPQPYVCANFVYDLNGNKGPNTLGKDIGFITTFSAIDSIVVAPMPLMTDAGSKPAAEAANACRVQDSESRMPNLYEGIALFVNRDLVGNLSKSDVYWTSSISSDGNNPLARYVAMSSGEVSLTTRTISHNIRCVKR